MNIIFLDIDGVLNSISSAVAFNEINKSKRRDNELELDVVSIGLLRKLCNDTDAKIVVSSTWRIGRDIEDLKEIFMLYSWEAPIISITRRGESCRGEEIQEWIDFYTNVKNYVIIDDDSDMLESQKDHFVNTNGTEGFRLKDLCKALRILSKPSLDLEAHAFFVKESERVN